MTVAEKKRSAGLRPRRFLSGIVPTTKMAGGPSGRELAGFRLITVLSAAPSAPRPQKLTKNMPNTAINSYLVGWSMETHQNPRKRTKTHGAQHSLARDAAWHITAPAMAAVGSDGRRCCGVDLTFRAGCHLADRKIKARRRHYRDFLHRNHKIRSFERNLGAMRADLR